MHSELFSIGPLTVHAYGLCMALGFLLSWLAAVRLCKKTGRRSDQLSNLITWLMISAIVGARAAYVMEHWTAEFAANPAGILRVDQGGLMFYGGLIAAAFTLAVYARCTRQRLFEVTDLILAVVPLGHALGRVGCFCHGCCYGRVTQSALGVCFPKFSPAWWEEVSAVPPLISQDAARSLPVLPTQLMEACANLALFGVLYFLYPRARERAGRVTGFYLMGYAVIRFFGEFLRGDPRMAVGPLSIGQAISVGLFAFGAVCAAWRAGDGKARGEKPEAGDGSGQKGHG